MGLESGVTAAYSVGKTVVLLRVLSQIPVNLIQPYNLVHRCPQLVCIATTVEVGRKVKGARIHCIGCRGRGPLCRTYHRWISTTTGAFINLNRSELLDDDIREQRGGRWNINWAARLTGSV